MAKPVWLVPALTLVLAAVVLGYLAKTGTFDRRVTLSPAPYAGPLHNPLSGFVPEADDPDIVRDNTLVYVDVTWRELEPEQDRYDFAALEKTNYLDQWRTKGKRVVFRFVCDIPRDEKHMDIPDWLYDMTGKDGDWYDTSYGKGYSPNYANPVFLERHRRAIEALGRIYGKDDFFAYIELGSLGHWGEWHTKIEDGIRPLPPEDVRDQYVQPYVESFPSAKLLMRRPFRTAADNGFGLYNDMTGEPESTAIWLDWIAHGGDFDQTSEQGALVPMPDAWKTAPMGGEFTSGIPMKDMTGKLLDQTLRLLRDSHMTFSGPMHPLSGEGDAEAIDAIQAALGSRLRIQSASLSQPFWSSETLSVNLDWINDGIAPFYWDWQAELRLYDENGEQVSNQPVDVALTGILDGQAVASHTVLSTGEIKKGTYTVGIAILDPLTGLPAYHFAMEGVSAECVGILGQWVQD